MSNSVEEWQNKWNSSIEHELGKEYVENTTEFFNQKPTLDSLLDIAEETQREIDSTGKKETEGKLNYEFDWEFIEQMAIRMQLNKDKYKPYNWKKPIDPEKLKQSIQRHHIEVMKGNYEDDGQNLGHIVAYACNAMMLYYQIQHMKNNSITK